MRQLQERGLEALPFYTELCSVAGQFAAYLAPPVPAGIVSSGVQTGGGSQPGARASWPATTRYHCIAVAKLLNRSGQREAMMRVLSNTLAVNDDP